MAAAAMMPRWLDSACMRFNLLSDSFMGTLSHGMRWGRRVASEPALGFGEAEGAIETPRDAPLSWFMPPQIKGLPEDSSSVPKTAGSMGWLKPATILLFAAYFLVMAWDGLKEIGRASCRERG